MSEKAFDLLKRFSHIPGYKGHSHFWEQLTRSQFLATASGAVGLALGSRSWVPDLVEAASRSGAVPRPIPGGLHFLELFFGYTPPTELYHVFGVKPGVEPSTITDFRGFVGGAVIQGNVQQIDANTGATTLRFFDNDMRFMKGDYIGVDGKQHTGTFGFL